MTIEEYLTSERKDVSLSIFCIKGKTDKSGKLIFDPLPHAKGTITDPDNLYGLIEESEAEKFLEKLNSGTKSGNEFFSLKNPKGTRILWKFKPDKNGIHYKFTAYPVDDKSLINMISCNSTVTDIVLSCPDLFLMTNEDGEIIFINPYGIKTLNLEDDFLTKKPNISELITNIDNKDMIFDRLKAGKIIQEIELAFRRPDEDDLIGLTSIFSISCSTGNLICFHIVDVSERVKNFSSHMKNSILLMNLNEDLKKTQSQLLNQEKMASIGQLSSGIAHELNNPLGYVFNNVNVLFNYMKDIKNYILQVRKLYSSKAPTDAQIEQLEKMDTNIDLDFIFNDMNDIAEETIEGVDRIKSIINSLKSFSQKDSMTSFSLNNLNNSLKDTLVILRSEYKHKMNITTEYGDIPDIFCNIHELNQAFLNIIKNAIEAVKENSTTEKGRIIITTSAGPDSVRVKIFNSGPGIPENIKKRIFEPFFTTRDVGAGTGLGLSIAHDVIVNKHNGTIKVENLEDGVQFVLTIPFEEELGFDS